MHIHMESQKPRHNCWVCKNSTGCVCQASSHFGQTVTFNTPVCDQYEYAGTEEYLKRIMQEPCQTKALNLKEE